jgi:hypothetical protein
MKEWWLEMIQIMLRGLTEYSDHHFIHLQPEALAICITSPTLNS